MPCRMLTYALFYETKRLPNSYDAVTEQQVPEKPHISKPIKRLNIGAVIWQSDLQLKHTYVIDVHSERAAIQ